ncbi:MAG: hypothetical protein V4550_18310 [Gemmatimonadota bacterium]
MRVYVLKESDFRRLTTALDAAGFRMPPNFTPEQVEEMYRHFNYHVRRWIESVKNDDIKGEFE